jgi:hypothetical protein
MICEEPDFIFPMQADIYYPVVEQGTYGELSKQWIIDRTIAGNFIPLSKTGKEEVSPNVNITKESILVCRVKNDIRISSSDDKNSVTNVIVTNIRDRNCREVYIETSGPRKNKSTIYEIASQEPYLGPFGSVEYYNVVLRRSENQASNA